MTLFRSLVAHYDVDAIKSYEGRQDPTQVLSKLTYGLRMAVYYTGPKLHRASGLAIGLSFYKRSHQHLGSLRASIGKAYH